MRWCLIFDQNSRHNGVAMYGALVYCLEAYSIEIACMNGCYISANKHSQKKTDRCD